ncbi:MAG: hypothetical protein LBI39_02095 [Puniceicoccales bacterium]|nr:hypothetical protein [Puniceicoccales bacterium]
MFTSDSKLPFTAQSQSHDVDLGAIFLDINSCFVGGVSTVEIKCSKTDLLAKTEDFKHYCFVPSLLGKKISCSGTVVCAPEIAKHFSANLVFLLASKFFVDIGSIIEEKYKSNPNIGIRNVLLTFASGLDGEVLDDWIGKLSTEDVTSIGLDANDVQLLDDKTRKANISAVGVFGIICGSYDPDTIKTLKVEHLQLADHTIKAFGNARNGIESIIDEIARQHTTDKDQDPSLDSCLELLILNNPTLTNKLMSYAREKKMTQAFGVFQKVVIALPETNFAASTTIMQNIPIAFEDMTSSGALGDGLSANPLGISAGQASLITETGSAVAISGTDSSVYAMKFDVRSGTEFRHSEQFFKACSTISQKVVAELKPAKDGITFASHMDVIIRGGKSEQLAAMTEQQVNQLIEHRIAAKKKLQGNEGATIERDEVGREILRTAGAGIYDAQKAPPTGFSDRQNPRFSEGFVETVRQLPGDCPLLGEMAILIPDDIVPFITVQQAGKSGGALFRELGSSLGPDRIRLMPRDDEELSDSQLEEKRKDGKYTQNYACRDLFLCHTALNCQQGGGENVRIGHEHMTEEQIVLAANSADAFEDNEQVLKDTGVGAKPCGRLMALLGPDTVSRLHSAGYLSKGGGGQTKLKEPVRLAILQHQYFGECPFELSGEQIFEIAISIATCGRPAEFADDDDHTPSSAKLPGGRFDLPQTMMGFVERLTPKQAVELAATIEKSLTSGNAEEVAAARALLLGTENGKSSTADIYHALAPKNNVFIAREKLGPAAVMPSVISGCPSFMLLRQKAGGEHFAAIDKAVIASMIDENLAASDPTMAAKISAVATTLLSMAWVLSKLFPINNLLPGALRSSESSFWKMIEAANANVGLAVMRFLCLLHIIFFGFFFASVRARFYVAWRVFDSSDSDYNAAVTPFLLMAIFSARSADEMHKSFGDISSRRSIEQLA